ncbi:MAG: TetR/AcrR family transcriptional regulator [Lachnospiraceae bacterium]|nr:TetR/AcrR family transcriptional regulator [Lachnospiraceae bacterium]
MSDRYHHGNLRQALIDAGIRIINESGEDKLSLRKAAALCRVSHAAPYAHFKDKEELIGAIKASVTEQFTEELKRAVDGEENAESALVEMGRSYVSFFVCNPDYFKFLFSSLNIVAHIRPDRQHKEDYPPFVRLKETYLKYLKEKGIKKSRDEQEADILRLWASAHGLAAIACMSGVETSFDWNDRGAIEALLL